MSPAATDRSLAHPGVTNLAADHILEISGYSGGFQSPSGQFKAVLDDVSFYIARSSLTALVGETGSGKTLMALSVLGILPSTFRRTAGSVMFEGSDICQMGQADLRHVRGAKVSIVFQDARAALNPVFTVGRQISDVCRLHRHVGKKQALDLTEEMLRRVRVPEAARRMRQYPHEFSGGMAQRAQLAMALISQPSLLVLDEPTTGLDVTIQADILDLVVDLNRADGMSTLLITHDLGIVAETCEHVVVMQDGKVREAGSCVQIMTEPSSPYTRQLISDSRVDGGLR
jgi:ABC-type glutathione transport system ATPase component